MIFKHPGRSEEGSAVTENPKPTKPVNQPAAKVVYGVHAVRPEEICATRFVTGVLATAERYAKVMSTDPGVLAAAVTRYLTDTDGERRAEALYVNGKRQDRTSRMTGGC
jgi:hypothetical protein